MNNLEIVQHAAMGCGFADDDCIELDNGTVSVVIVFPYSTRVGNNPHYLLSYNNGGFVSERSFQEAMDHAAALLR